MTIEFGMLQQIKTQSLIKSSQGAQIKQTATMAESVFDEYEKYKSQLAQANENGGATPSTTNTAFGSPAMSVAELEAKMAECEAKFAEYYAIVNDQTGTTLTGSPENKDDKNKIQQKNFSGLMA